MWNPSTCDCECNKACQIDECQNPIFFRRCMHYNPLVSNMISYEEKTINILLITGMIIIK